jgi:hypothetical protein
MIDTRGLGTVLKLTALIPAVAILLVLFAAPLDLSRITVVAAAIATGAFLPPITPVIRSIWRQRYDDEHARRTAFARRRDDRALVHTGTGVDRGTGCHRFAARSGLAWLFTAAAVPLLIASGGSPGGNRRRPRSATCSAVASPECSSSIDVLRTHRHIRRIEVAYRDSRWRAAAAWDRR